MDNTGIVIIDLVTNYLCEVFAGECIDIGLQIGDLTERSFRIYYRLKRGDEIIALAKTGIVPFIYGFYQIAPEIQTTQNLMINTFFINRGSEPRLRCKALTPTSCILPEFIIISYETNLLHR